jgi:asparagine N-glycosylation enzyme membrane subunit Stt3
MGVAALLTHAALGSWLGSILFFSFVGAPALFQSLEEDRAGAAVNVLFPRYYVFGLGMAVLTVLAWLLGPLLADASVLSSAPSPSLLPVAGLAVAGSSNVYARYRLVPKMEAAGEDAFAQYHKQSVALNLLTLAGVAVAFAALHL